jgi:hypothetical protein
MPSEIRQPASFRDPSGFLFQRAGVLYRQVNQSYRREYDQLMASGLYENLVKRGWLIPHEEVTPEPSADDRAYKIIQPTPLAFISYPFEWSFSQLKDAALLTLKIQQRALRYGMSLKDSSAYNIQFHLKNGKPVLIDTLSFETYEEGQPWVAYRQFCQHFLAPLAVMAYTDIRLSQLLRVYIDGMPLDLVSSLLPGKTRLNFGLLTHLHVHASAQKRYAGQSVDTAESGRQMSKTSLLGLIDSLLNTVKKLSWQPADTDWGDYYEDTNYSDQAMSQKEALVADFVSRAAPEMVWDLGANTGRFSRIASQQGISTIAFDIDPAAVEKNYLQIKAQKESHLLPLIIDLTNPSAGIGWANQERDSLSARANADMILALALVHHLAISNNVPLEMIAAHFSQLAPWLVIEFVPKTDSQVQRLLVSREDIFEAYTQEGFEQAFRTRYHLRATEAIQGSERRLYLMERK